jgi:biotin carboxylase
MKDVVRAATGRARAVIVIDSEDLRLDPRIATLAQRLNLASHICDLNDPDQILNLCKIENAAGALTGDDRWCCAVDIVNYSLGLSPSLDRWNKLSQRQLLRDYGAPCPTFRRVASSEDLLSFGSQNGYPFIVKPARGTSSRSVTLLSSPEQTRMFPMSADELWVAEGFIYGKPRADPRLSDYFSVDLIGTSNGRFGFVTDTLQPSDAFRECGSLVPSTLDEGAQLRAMNATHEAWSALKLTRGSIHAEMKLGSDTTHLIEVNGRVGGWAPQLVSLGADLDLPTEIFKAALGQEVLGGVEWRRSAGVITFQAPIIASTVLCSPRKQDLLRVRGVRSVSKLETEGRQIDGREGTPAHVARIYLTSETRSDLMRVMTEALAFLSREFQFADSNGDLVKYSFNAETLEIA